MAFSFVAGFFPMVGMTFPRMLALVGYDGLASNLFWANALGWFASIAYFVIGIYITALLGFLASPKRKIKGYSPVRLSIDKDFLNDSGPKTWAKFYRSFLSLLFVVPIFLMFHFDLFTKIFFLINDLDYDRTGSIARTAGAKNMIYSIEIVGLGWLCYWWRIWWRDLVARDKLKSQELSDVQEKISDEDGYKMTNILRRYNLDLKKYYNTIKWEYLFITFLILSATFTAFGALIAEMEKRGELDDVTTTLAIAFVASPVAFLVLGYLLLLAFYIPKKDRVFFKNPV